MPKIVAFSQQSPAPAFDRPRPDRLVSGNPLRTTWSHYDSAAGEFSCGVWQCEPGSWNIQFAANKEEFFCVIEGRVRLHQSDGTMVEIAAGEAAVIPAGFVGRFEVIEMVKKYYVVLERGSAA
jgi:uncharacterized cupin superfamily protein